jgi:hypothetical protein
VQPLEPKHKVAIALGLVVLGLMIWVSAKTLAPVPSPVAPAQSASQGMGPRLDVNMPDKVVTMLGVPEVILSPQSSSRDDAGPSEDKPSKPAGDTEQKPSSATRVNSNTPVTIPRKAARRSDDTFLVKPE